MGGSQGYEMIPVGWVRSPLKERSQAPRQGSEGAPDARVQIEPRFAEAIEGIKAGHEILLLTWLHRAERDILKVRPRSDPRRRLTGVFATRSPDRPNPVGLHRVKVRAVDADLTIHVQGLEAIDGTPVIDVKPVLACVADC